MHADGSAADARTCCAHVRARVGAGVLRRALIRAEPCERVPSAWTACGLGAQAFYSAAAFNANIGAWNTARVTDVTQVCAAPGAAARTMADALGRGFDAARPVVRGGTADARACEHVRALACAGDHVCRYGCAEERFDTFKYTYMHMHIHTSRIIYIRT